MIIAQPRPSVVYHVRMARVNISMADDLYGVARALGLNISQLAQQAVRAELSRRAKVAALDAYLAELEDLLGPIPEEEQAAARAWADAIGGPPRQRHSA